MGGPGGAEQRMHAPLACTHAARSLLVSGLACYGKASGSAAAAARTMLCGVTLARWSQGRGAQATQAPSSVTLGWQPRGVHYHQCPVEGWQRDARGMYTILYKRTVLGLSALQKRMAPCVGNVHKGLL